MGYQIDCWDRECMDEQDGFVPFLVLTVSTLRDGISRQDQVDAMSSEIESGLRHLQVRIPQGTTPAELTEWLRDMALRIDYEITHDGLTFEELAPVEQG